MHFKLLKGAGNHSQVGKDGKLEIFTSKEGRVIKSDLDLVKMFANKFERVEVDPRNTVEKTEVQKAAEEGAKDLKPASEEENPLGKDVTKQFTQAVAEDFKVFAKGDDFFVTEDEAPTIVIHEEPLKKREVNKFIKKYLQE